MFVMWLGCLVLTATDAQSLMHVSHALLCTNPRAPSERVVTTLTAICRKHTTSNCAPATSSSALNNKSLLCTATCSRALLCVYQLHGAAINALVIHDGFAVTGSDDKQLRVWPMDFSDFLLEVSTPVIHGSRRGPHRLSVAGYNRGVSSLALAGLLRPLGQLLSRYCKQCSQGRSRDESRP